jgi:hypothetical protein
MELSKVHRGRRTPVPKVMVRDIVSVLGISDYDLHDVLLKKWTVLKVIQNEHRDEVVVTDGQITRKFDRYWLQVYHRPPTLLQILAPIITFIHWLEVYHPPETPIGDLEIEDLSSGLNF